MPALARSRHLACALVGAAVVIAGCGGSDDGSKDAAKVDAELRAKLDAKVGTPSRAPATQGERTVPPTSTGPRRGTSTQPGSATTRQQTKAPGPGRTSAQGEASTQPTPGTQARPAARALLSAADRASFARLAAQLPGEEGVAVTTLGRGRTVYRAGSLRTGVAWSTAKVPVAIAAVQAGVAEHADLVQAITASDNAAAERLWAALGDPASAARAATAQLRAGGDERTQIQSERLRGSAYTAFGQTQWALTDQARFAGGLHCVKAAHAVIALMRQVVPGQRWGLGSTGLPALFKAGWGPGVSAGAAGGWLDRQMGIVKISGHPIAVAMATTAGDHATGTRNLDAIAHWVVTHVDASHAPRSPRC